MELPPRAGSYHQSRRSRSQRDRERKMTGAGGRDPRPYSPSSGSDREAVEAPGSSRPRPPRRRRRESTSCEEDIIDGFAIASFPTLEALEKDAVPKPPERADSQRKRQEKRKPEENQPSSPCEGPRGAEGSEREQNRHNGDRNPPPTKKVKTKGPTRGNESTGGENGSSQRSSSRGAGSDVSAHSSLGTGYFCDIDSDPDDKPLGDEALCSRRLDCTSAQDKALHSVWQRISFAASDDGLSNFFIAANKIGSDVNSTVIPQGETKVSGLERSQERNQGSDKDPLLVPSLPAELAPQAAPAAPAAAGSAQAPEGPQAQPEVVASAPAGSRTPVLPSLSNHRHHHHHIPPQQPQQQQHRQSMPARVNPQPKPQTLVQSQPKVQPFSQQQLVYLSRSSTPSKTLTSAPQLPHRASTPSSLTSLGLSSQAASHGFVPALRPSSHPAHPHPGMFTPSPGLPPPPPLTTSMLQVAGHPSPAAVAAFSEQELIRQELNSRYLSSQGSERGAALGPPSFQFHQHSHQHQHTHQHTHQHFAPYPTIPQPGLVPAPAPSMYFQGYPVSGIPSVLPPAGPFGSVQGAFQPKTPNPDLTPRSGPVPHTLLQKDPRLTEAYRPTIRKPGKWCAMHVQIAWMIYQHQEKNKMINPDHHKLDFTKTDLLSRNPSSLFGPVTHSHEMARSATLFAAADPGHAAPSPFVTPNTLNTFLNPSSHLDPYGRTPAYSAIGQLTNRAFGGLGNPAVAVSTVFSHKDNAAAQSMGHSRDNWNRLHQTPPSFPTPPPAWPRLAEVERERGSLLDKEPDTAKPELAFIKEEKEREAVYGRHQIRVSPAAHKTGGSGAPAVDEERGRPRSSSEPRGPSREGAEPGVGRLKQEQRGREYQPPPKRPGEDAGKAGAAGREPSPYSRLGAAPEASRPSLQRELAKRHEVKVKEERKEEHDMVAAGAALLPGFESAQLHRAQVPAGALHALHPLPMPLAVVGQVNGLGVLERGRVLAGPYLGVGHPGVAAAGGAAGERLGPYGGWEPFREPWRGPEMVAPPLPSRYPAAQPRYYEAERAYRERALLRELVPEALLAEARREQEASGFLEQPSSPQLLLHEEYDQRARLLGYLGPHPHHYPRVSPSLVHPAAGLLSKTPPMATLGAPPPLISSSSSSTGSGGRGRPGSPVPRATPLSASELRDLSAYAQKDRDSR